eukprot:XP_012810591.1 PREDICTED: uncharacterized protein LOC101732294 isoform X2 [Xenopus tropicalis]
MKNGKRKILAADTADLRDVWMEFLWKSMQLPGPGRHLSSCTWYDIPRLLERASSASGEGLEEELRPDSPPCDHVFGHLDETPLLLHSADKDGGVTTQPLYPTDGGVTTQPLYPTDGGVTAQLDYSESDSDSDYAYDVPRPVGGQIGEKRKQLLHQNESSEASGFA